jgi:hypothetical protein
MAAKDGICLKHNLPSLPIRVNIHTLNNWEGDSSMDDWPEWLVEGLHKRFDELSLTVEQQEQISPLIEKSSKLLMDLKNQVDDSAQGILFEWEDAVHYQQSAEKEWLYLRGVKDGMGWSKRLSFF